MEQTADALAARRLIHEANTAFKAADLTTAKAKYEEGLQKWRTVLDAFPDFKEESTFVDDLKDEVDHYRKLLEQLDLKFPEDFPFSKTFKKTSPPAGSAAGQRAQRRDRRSDAIGHAEKEIGRRGAANRRRRSE